MAGPFYNLAAFQAGCALVNLLPRSFAHALAAWLGRMGYRRNAAAREAARANLGQISGQGGAELEALCAANVQNFSRMMADYFLCTTARTERIEALLHEWRGFEHLENARARGKGIVLVTAHFGNWELGGTLLALRGLPMTVITLDEPTSQLTRWRDRQRQLLGIKTIAVGPGHDFAFVEMMQALRRNEIIAMLIDRPYAGTGTTVRFFDRPAEFSTAPALLWRHTDAAIIPAFVLENSTRGYVSFADPALPFARTNDARADLVENTQRLAMHFEAIIRDRPDQWFNYAPVWKE
ncbi:MAG TPA: lysophospholipid acyltransferase family protein, partial [Chthoniobacteraceae bacterium]|nr:lysophospholipid acyltransferase family protein [Chthoniobacteraceae bacterium]